MKLSIFVATILLSALLPAAKWNADSENAQVHFTVKGPFGTVNGSFTGLKADIKFSADDLAGSSFIASIDAKTISTGIGLRNRDLRKEEVWFNTDKYPLISFRSGKIEKKGNEFTASGELTMKGKTNPAEISFTFTQKGETGVFKGNFTLNREDFNLGKPGGSVGKEVKIDLVIPVKK